MKHLSSRESKELLTRTESFVAEERRATVVLIEHLEEISRRMLFAELGYASLWEFATQELGLSEGAAQRRIQAMRLVRDVPSAKASLETGKLSLCNAAKVQSFRQAERKQGRTQDAQLLVAQVERLSQRDCERKLIEISPQSMPRERDRIVAATEERELTIVVSPELHDQLQRIKGLLAHTLPNATYADLLQYMATETLARLEKKKGIEPKGANNNKLTQATIAAAAEERPEAALPTGQRVYLPAPLRHEVFARSGGQCEYTAQNRRCTSRHGLEIDHRMPLALGGSNEGKNLRILCRSHNAQQAREKLGLP